MMRMMISITRMTEMKKQRLTKKEKMWDGMMLMKIMVSSEWWWWWWRWRRIVMMD